MAVERTAEAVLTRDEAQRLFSFSGITKFLIGALVFYAFVYWYEQTFAFSKGLDYFSKDFQIYWASWLKTELVLEVVIASLLWGWIWKTRDRALDRITPQVELSRYFGNLVWLMAYTFTLYFAAWFTEQDGAWHQTVIRDTDFTPSHIIEFYMSYPIYIIIGVGAYLHARTRIPQFAKAHSLPYIFLVGLPLMILVNVGLNEFGHTAWIMEELFVAPLHWGFVTLSTGGLALLGVLCQMAPRVNELLHGRMPERKAA